MTNRRNILTSVVINIVSLLLNMISVFEEHPSGSQRQITRNHKKEGRIHWHHPTWCSIKFIIKIFKLRLHRLLKNVSRPQTLTFCCHIFDVNSVFVCHVAEDREDGKPREETGHTVDRAGQQGVPADGSHTVSESVSLSVTQLTNLSAPLVEGLLVLHLFLL